jgi:hypothetical protein
MQIWTEIEKFELTSEIQEVATKLSGMSQIGCYETPADG